MHIALVTSGFPPDLGGVETVVERLAHSLRAHNEVDVFTHRPRGLASPSYATDASLRVTRFPDWTGSHRFSIAPGLWAYLKRHGNDFEVIHAHSFHASAALAAANMTRAPLVFTPHYHGIGHTLSAKVVHVAYDPLAARIFDRASVVICVSQVEAEMLVSQYPRAEPKITVIPNGIDIDSIAPALPFEVDRPVILSSGRLEEYKQVALGIRAMAYLGPEPMLVITGSGPYLGDLRALAEELKLADRVFFLGLLDIAELRRWQKTADVTLTLSRYEAFGLSLLEAAVAGSQVVASSIPAHLELQATTGDSVTMVPVDASPRDVAAAITSRLGHGSVGTRSLDVLSWQEIADLTVDTYRTAIKGSS